MHRLTVDEFHQAEKLPLVVVLDNVRSMYNVGSVFRTSDAFRVEAVYLCGITSTPPSAEIHKTALGAEDSVAWRQFADARQAVDELRAAGYEVYSVEQVHGSTPLQDFKPVPHKKYAVVLGNEVKGVQQEVVDASDGCLAQFLLNVIGKDRRLVMSQLHEERSSSGLFISDGQDMRFSFPHDGLNTELWPVDEMFDEHAVVTTLAQGPVVLPFKLPFSDSTLHLRYAA